MMKKLFAMLMVFVLCLGMVPSMVMTASAATIEGKCGPSATYTLTDDGVLTVSGTGAIEKNAFGSSAKNNATLNKGFTDYLKIQKVVINEGITEISYQAFNGCSSITSVALPSTITKIQDNAFFQCTNLKSINLPEGLTHIGTNAFYGCKNLTEITLPSTLTSLGNAAFQNCSSLKTVIFSEGMTATIPQHAFWNAILTDITIPASVTKLNQYAFWAASKLKNVTIKNNDITLGNQSFSASDIIFTVPCNFDKTKITASVVNNKTFTFSSDYLHTDANNDGICDAEGCSTATVASVSMNTNSVTLNAVGATETLTATITPSNVTADLTWRSDNSAVATVNNGVVTAVGEGIATITVEAGGKTAKCTITVSLPQNPVTGVSLSQTALTLAVNDTYELDAVISPTNADNKNVTWSSNANNIATVDNDGVVTALTTGSATITVTTQDGGKTATCSITVVNSHEHTWDSYTGACGGCSLTHYTHGTYEWNNGNCSVCGVAGGYCGYVGTETSVEYILTSTDTGNTYTLTISGYGSMGEYIDYNDSSNPPWYDYRTKITSVIIQNGVNDIGWGAFKYHTALQNVSIPNSVTEIKRAAFIGASSLTSITLPSSITKIGQAVFKESGLTSISIPSGVTQIQGSTFSGCTKLATVTLPNSITEIEGNAFQQCSSLSQITLPTGLTTVGEWAFNQSGLTSVTILSSVTSLGMHTFSGCPNLKTVMINGTDLTIADRAFQGDEALEALTINNTGNVSIGDYAFMIEVAEDDAEVDIGDVGIGGWTPADDDQIETQSSINSRSTVKYTSQSETGEIGKDKLYTITLPDNVTYTTDYATSFKNRVRAVDIGDTATVLVGNSIKASPAFTSDTAFDETLTWSTSNPEVATVDANGKVTGVSAGSATITATSKYKLNEVFRADSCVITVKQHTHEWIYFVNVAKDTITATCSNTDNNCPNADGGSVSIALPDSVEYTGNAIEAKVTDNLIPEHTVVYSGDGLVAGKPVTPGTYTATITLGTAEISVSYTITDVLNGITVTADPTGDIAIPTKGNTQSITLTAKADYAYNDAEVTADTTWSLADTYNGVTIESNVITIAPEANAGTISVKASYIGKEQTTTINLTKEGAGELYALSEITGADSVSVNGATTDQNATYDITGEDKYGTIVEPIVTWSVAGMDGVTIDANGVLTVPKDAPAGAVTITATAGSLTKTKTVSITAHEHSWTYVASGVTLTATCGNTGCLSTNTELKIIAPALTVYGDTESEETTLSATSIGGIATLPAIRYEQKNGESWTVLSGAPDVPGSYRASITVDTATASVEYTIDQATLTVNGTGIASGTYGAKLSELTVSGLGAELNGTEVPGTWMLTGDDVPNVGDTGSYSATFTPAANAAYYKPLTAQVTLNIAPAQHAAPTAVVGSYAPNADKTAFVYTVSKPSGIAYEYSTNGADWQDSPIFDGFNAGDKATFYARVKEDSNHTASDSMQSDEVTFEKLDQAAPALSYQVSGNSGNRTITIAEVDGAEYSFDGGNTWGSSNVLTGINDETVNIAIRMKETAVYKASEKVSASVNTAKQVQTVTFDTTDRTATYGDGTLEARAASAEGAITYESSDTAVATVDDKGVVTIVGTGTATITAKAAETETHASAQASYSLTVNPKVLTAEDITLTLTESLYQYDGTAKTPVVLLKDGNTVLEADKDYQVKDGSTTTASAIAVYTITLTGKGNYTGNISEEWEITKIVAPAAPQNLQGIAPTTGLVNDGKIIGTTDEMEYATKVDFSDAKDCGEGETTNLAPGTYYVRLKGTDTTEPGAAAVVNVPAYSALVITFDANGGTVVIASVTTEQDGTLAELPTATRNGHEFNGWFTAKTGGTQVTADTFFSVSTTIYARWTYIPVPPVIDSPAADTIVEVYEGQTAQMTVVSQNATSYQWFINRNDGAGFVEYDGSTLATHTTAAVKPENDGFRYYCVVTNADGSVRSHVFTLKVLEQIDLPQTGDNSHIGLWAAMCLLSMAGILLLWKKPCSR